MKMFPAQQWSHHTACPLAFDVTANLNKDSSNDTHHTTSLVTGESLVTHWSMVVKRCVEENIVLALSHTSDGQERVLAVLDILLRWRQRKVYTSKE